MRLVNKSKIIIRMLIFLMIIITGIITGIMYSGAISLSIILITLISVLYYFIIMRLIDSTGEVSILCDGRFYVFTVILIYTILPPIYGLLTYGENHGIRMRRTYTAITYTSNELMKTLVMSTLFFLGLLIGVYLRNYGKRHFYQGNTYNECGDNSRNTKLFYLWLGVCVVSTLAFLTPFFRGGFRTILHGGTISDVETTHGSSFIWKVLDTFFSLEMMTASTVAVLYYGYKRKMSSRRKKILLFSIVFLETVLAYVTTRRARAIAIILCAFIIYIGWYINVKHRLPMGQIITVGIVFLFLYFLEAIMGHTQTGRTYAGYLQLFDGVAAYDSLLLSTRESPSITMLSNIVYGLFRNIPIIGKYIIRLLGFNQDKAPLYKWMAERYVTYQFGGGLAYTPQLEAYLSAGFFGCAIFGFIYGYIFGKKRRGLANLFVAAMAFSIARGNLEVVLSLIWPFGIIGYYLYDQFLFRRVRFGSSSVHRVQTQLRDP